MVIGKADSKNSYPKGIGQIHIQVKEIITLIMSKAGQKSDMKVLDAAAGNGYLTNWMINQGLSVTPVDIAREQWAVKGVACEEIDLNQKLPYPDRSFDLIVSVETIEHLENPYHILREFSRLLKPSGFLIVSTPNVHSFKSRIKYPILGLPSLFEFVKDDSMGQHISPVSIGHFLYSFDRNNMTLEDVYSSGLKRSFWKKTIISIFNFICLLFLKAIKAGRSHADDFYIYRLSNRQLRSLFDDLILIIIARKQGSAVHEAGVETGSS